MMKQSKLVPIRRFEGFTEEWKQIMLGDISDIKTGPFGSTLHAKDYVKSGQPIITTEHFKQGYLPKIKKDIPQVSESDYSRLEPYKLQVDDIVFSRVGSVDINALVASFQEGWLFSGRVLRVRPQRKIHSLYLHYLLETESVKNDVLSRAVGQTMPSINTEILKNTYITLSGEFDEQRKIASILQKVDNAMVLQQKKIDKTKALKSAYLAEMFPAEGERVPKRRFSGFKNEWKNFKFDNVTDMSNNLRIPVTASKRIPGSIPYYGANGIQDYVEGSTHDGEFVLIAEDGANDLINYPVNYVKGEIWVNNHAHVVTGKIGIMDNIFLVSRMRSMDISKWLVGGGRAKLNAEVLKSIQIVIPSFEEQKKIGLLFKQIDNIIRTQQKRLNKLKATKQAYLKEMFV